MTIPVKPTVRTRAEQIAAGVEAGYLRDVPGVVEALDAHAAMVAQIDAQPFVAAEKVKRRTALDDETRTKVDEAVASATRQAVRQLDQEEGALRASLQGAATDPQAMFRMTRAHLFATQATQALGAHEIDTVWENATLTGDVEVIRAAGLAGRKRLSDLVAVQQAPAQLAEARSRFLAFEGRFQRWARANPTPAERLVAIDRERANLAMRIEESAKFAARLYGLGPAPPPIERRPVPDVAIEDRMRVAPGFDALAGVNRHDVRR